MSERTLFIEFAAVIIFMLKFKVSYLPDYALTYLDVKTDFSELYGNEEQLNVMRSQSSLMR